MKEKTKKNLMEAFAGESQANRKYLAFSNKAEQEGYPGVAKLFKAAAAAETVHAHSHLRALGGINTTKENLQEAISGETHEFNSMYPKMIEEAKAEGESAAERSFVFANKVEQIHAELYKNALNNLDNFPVKDYYVCSVCGYTVADEAPEKCPVCGAMKKAFNKVE
ncbi:MAG: Rubrerythrin [Candidatus Methanofastidiosum methylothiophilum]|uniref:Rubrerythrin n=1 Tax=Candidatus Methanofastidiosum methylothiophilum TaxID=1705564 RepID=A0A150J8F9_9EURY|nr:MAG: Rubrerythrin [Candidatus Methanofastidiosum methylthiophilus]